MTLTEVQRSALRSVRLSWAPTYEEVWDSAAQTQNMHVDGLHTDVWEDLEDALGDAVASTGASPTGLVITGNAGTGKTHLLTRFREQVQNAGHYFVLLELLDATDFWRAALTSLRSSLLRPARDHQSQLAQLLWLLSDEAGLSRAHRREFSGDAVPTPAGLDALVTAMSTRRPQVRQYHGVLRALVLLASPDSRLADLGSAFLDDIEVEETAAERLHWGLPAHGFPAVETVRAISAFMAETAATVFAVDQIDTLLAQSAATLAAPDAVENEVIEQVGHGLMSLRQGLYRTVTVACMLPTAWETLSSRATASVAARFRVVGPLKSLPDGAIARAIVERRLSAAYRAKGFVPPHPTWPVAPEAFASAVHHTPRDLLTKVDTHIRSCVSTRSDFELASFDDRHGWSAPEQPAPASAPSTMPEPVAPADALARIDEQFEALRLRAQVGDVATDQNAADRRMGTLIGAGLSAWTREDGGEGFVIEHGNRQLDGRLRRRLTGRAEDEQHWSFRAIPAASAVAITNRVQSAATAAGVAAGTDRRKLFLLRSTPWPTSPKASAVIADATERGAELLPLDEADLATLDALSRLIAGAPDGLDEWLAARRPAHGLRLFAGLVLTEPRASSRPSIARRVRGLIPGDAVGRVGGLSSAVADVMFGGPPAPRPPEPAAPSAPSAPVDGAGAITVGTAPDGRELTVDLADLRGNTAVFAGAGSGKTVLLRRIVEECALRGVSAIVLDPSDDLARLGVAWPQAPSDWRPGDDERSRAYLAGTDVVVWTPNRPSGRPLGETIDPAVLLTPAAGKRARVSVISLGGLPDDEQRQAFIARLQLGLFEWLRRNPAGGRPLGALLVLDEAQAIAPAGMTRPATDSTLLLARGAAEYGLGMLVATSAPRGLHAELVGGSTTHFYGKLNAPAQIQAVKDLAAARGGRIEAMGGLGAGDFFLGAGASTVRVHAPMCLSFHPASPPTEDEVLVLARG